MLPLHVVSSASDLPEGCPAEYQLGVAAPGKVGQVGGTPGELLELDAVPPNDPGKRRSQIGGYGNFVEPLLGPNRGGIPHPKIDRT